MTRLATGTQTIVIVGTGLAGGNAAVTLRQEGWRGRIMLLGSEPTIPFGRPPLSNTYLRGEEDLSGWYVKPADWYGEHDIELRVLPLSSNMESIVGEFYTLLLLSRTPRSENHVRMRVDLPGLSNSKKPNSDR